jgi:Tfp pilus assembly protein PilO
MIKLSPRERNIFIGVLIVGGIWAINTIAISPLLAAKEQLDSDVSTASLSVTQANNLIHLARKDRAKWDQMVRYGLRNDPSTAESQMLHAIGDWARDAGLSLTGNKPDRAEAQKPFQKISFHVTSTGNLAAINRFLWDIETATIPTRVEDFTISSRKDGTDDLALSVAISTLCIVQPTTVPVSGTAEASR